MRYDLVAWFLAVLSVIALISLNPGAGVSIWWVTLSFAASLGLFAAWLWGSRQQRAGNWFHPVIIFSISYLIVFFQVPLCVAYGYYLPAYLYPFPEKINYCAVIAVLGLAAFYFGNCWARNEGCRRKARGLEVIYFAEGMRRVTRVLLILSWMIFFIFLQLAGAQLYSSFVYDGGANWGGGATYVHTVFVLISRLLIAVESVRLSHLKIESLKDYILKYDRGILIFLLVSSAPFLLMGDRGTLIAVLLGVFTPYFLFFSLLIRRNFLLLILIATVLLTFLGNSRTRDVEMTWEARIEKGVESIVSLSTSPNEWPTIELAGSYRTFNTAVGIVPAHYDYANGRFILGNISSVIPFFRFVAPLDTNTYIGSASLFFTNYLRNGDMSSGEGSSVLGATYLDFGAYGVAPVMFILGWIIRLAESNVRRNFSVNAVLWMFIFIYILFQAVKISRSDPFFWVQNVGWGALLFFLFIKPMMWRTGALKTAASGENARL